MYAAAVVVGDGVIVVVVLTLALCNNLDRGHGKQYNTHI